MAQNLTNAPKLLRMSDFRTVSDMYGSVAKSCRFIVHIKPTGYMANYFALATQLIYLCEAAEMPGRGFVNVDTHYYGPNQKLPILSQYEDINMTFLCRNSSLERKFFDDWQLMINPINTYDFNYRDSYACEIDIYQYSDVGKRVNPNPRATDNGIPVPTYCFTLVDAFPMLVNPQPGTWQDDMIQRVIVNFTFTKWIRKGIDPVSGTTNPFSGSTPPLGTFLEPLLNTFKNY